MTFLAVSIAFTGFAKAANTTPVDLNSIAPDSQAILEGLAHKGHKGGDKNHGGGKDDAKKAEPPKACTDAAITDDQKAAIETAVYDYERAKVQDTADLKLAMMDYAHTAMDAATDKAAADAAGTKISEGVAKMASAHVGLATKILYDIVTPAQRNNTFMCIMAMHKMKKRPSLGFCNLPQPRPLAIARGLFLGLRNRFYITLILTKSLSKL